MKIIARKVFFSMLFLIAITTAVSAQQRPSFESWQQLDQLLKNDDSVLLLDVRTPAEYESGHISGAILLPLNEISSNPPQVDRDTTIIVYCRSGNRSSQAQRLLENMGYSDVRDFGGIYRWGGDLNYGNNP